MSSMHTIKALLAACAVALAACAGGSDPACSVPTAEPGSVSFAQAVMQPAAALAFEGPGTLRAGVKLLVPAASSGARFASGRVLLLVDGAEVAAQRFTLEALPGAGPAVLDVELHANAAAGAHIAQLRLVLEEQAGAMDPHNVGGASLVLACD
jgi:hypothetical protein